MNEVYEKILLDPSHWDEMTKSFTFHSDDINKGFKKLGYKEYCFGGFSYVFTKEELSQIEIKKYEAEAQSITNKQVEGITKDINKKIIEEILKNERYKGVRKNKTRNKRIH